MPKLVQNGKVLEEHPTRAKCMVSAFERHLVHTHGTRRNQLLPGVRILGEDDLMVQSQMIIPIEPQGQTRRDFDTNLLKTRRVVKGRYWK